MKRPPPSLSGKKKAKSKNWKNPPFFPFFSFFSFFSFVSFFLFFRFFFVVFVVFIFGPKTHFQIIFESFSARKINFQVIFDWFSIWKLIFKLFQSLRNIFILLSPLPARLPQWSSRPWQDLLQQAKSHVLGTFRDDGKLNSHVFDKIGDHFGGVFLVIFNYRTG